MKYPSSYQHFCRPNWRYLLPALAILLAFLHSAQAEESLPDKFKIAIGGYSILRFDSRMSLTDPNVGAGISLSPEDTLGVNNEQTVLRLTGYYRFTEEHALTYAWYSISARGNKTIEEEFDWLDENGNEITIPVGAKVDSTLNYEIFKVGYLWSFYHTDKVELAIGAGLHVTRISVDLQADRTNSGEEAENVAVTVPLPVISFGLNYSITPKLSWGLKSEAFALKYGDSNGLYTDITLSMEYRVIDNIGVGVGLGSNALNITEDAPEGKFTYDNRISGLLLYTAAYF
jgi:hypothetical protein